MSHCASCQISWKSVLWQKQALHTVHKLLAKKINTQKHTKAKIKWFCKFHTLRKWQQLSVRYLTQLPFGSLAVNRVCKGMCLHGCNGNMSHVSQTGRLLYCCPPAEMLRSLALSTRPQVLFPSCPNSRTLMSRISCWVGVSMGTLLSMTPCMAEVHLMASFSILV